jgi:hypothetical protein
MSLGDTGFSSQVFILHERVYRIPRAFCSHVSVVSSFCFRCLLYDDSMVVDVWITLSSKDLFQHLTFPPFQYWLIRGCKIDVPALYDPHGRYRYWNGIVSSSFSWEIMESFSKINSLELASSRYPSWNYNTEPAGSHSQYQSQHFCRQCLLHV